MGLFVAPASRALANFSLLRILWSTMVVHMRHTKGHTANRRSHHALKSARFETCPKCSAKHLMHRVCGNCGTYRGRTVIDTMKKTLRLAKKAEARKGSTTPESAPKENVKELKTPKKAKQRRTRRNGQNLKNKIVQKIAHAIFFCRVRAAFRPSAVDRVYIIPYTCT